MTAPYHNDRDRSYDLYSNGLADQRPADTFDDYAVDPPSTKTELAVTTVQTESTVEFADRANPNAWIRSTVWYTFVRDDDE